MVKEVMDKTGYDAEFVKLTDFNYSACKGCVWLCAEPEVCRLEDDLLPYYQKIKEADTVVLGSPVQFRTVSPTMLAFISRLWGFRHVNFAIKNKPFTLWHWLARLTNNLELWMILFGQSDLSRSMLWM